MSKTREQYPLSPKKPLKKTLASMILWSMVLLVAYGSLIPFLASTSFVPFLKESNGQFSLLTPIIWSILIVLILFFLIFLLTYIYQKWYFEVYFYDLTENFIIIRKGVVTPREITIPYERVQDVYVDQDILDRMFGLYDVHLSSATITSGFEAHIDGVEKPAADGLRQQLLKVINEKISKKDNAPSPIVDKQIPNE